MTDDRDFDKADFVPPSASANESVTKEGSATESDEPFAPIKKQNTQPTTNTAKKTAAKKTAMKAAGKKKQVDEETNVEIVDSEVELPKLKKIKLQEEINIAGKEFEEKEAENKSSKLPSSKRGRGDRKPAPKADGVPLWRQATTGGNKKTMKREGAIGDISTLFDQEIMGKRPERSDQNHGDVPIDKT